MARRSARRKRKTRNALELPHAPFEVPERAGCLAEAGARGHEGAAGLDRTDRRPHRENVRRFMIR